MRNCGCAGVALRAFSYQMIASSVRDCSRCARPDPAVKQADLGIAGTEPDGLLLGRDKLLDRPGHELAPAEMGVCVGPVAVKRDHRLVFGNGLVISVLRAQHLGFGEMRGRAAGRGGQGSLGQVFRAHNICRGRVGHRIEDTGRERDRQPALRRRRTADRAPTPARTASIASARFSRDGGFNRTARPRKI